MTSLITGGAGFIGTHLATALRRQRCTVLIYDLKYGNDVRDFDALQKAMKGVRTVFHLAAVSSIEDSEADLVGSGRTNITGTLNVLRAAEKRKVKRIIFASSAAVYGWSLYGRQKQAGEFICDGFPGLNIWRLRLFNVYGRGAKRGVVPTFIRWARSGEPLSINGDGYQRRDMVYVYDVVRAMMMCGTASVKTAGTYDIGSGKSISINEIAQTIAAGRYIPLVHGSSRTDDIRKSQADIRRARFVLGWKPKVKFSKRIKAML